MIRSNPRHRLRPRGRGALGLEVGGRGGLGVRGHDGRDALHPGERADLRLGLGAGGLQRRRAGRVDLQDEAHGPALDVQRPNHAGAREVAAPHRIGHGPQGV